jgi:N-hydroxyarylamine O-acetyltransferase
MTLMVTLPDRWLVDVGFGDSFLEPLLLDEPGAQVQRDRAYRIVRDSLHLKLEQRLGKEEWKPQYRFTLEPYQYPDYAEMCRYHQTSPQSHFTRARICSRATPEGRISLSGLRFIETAGANRVERILASDKECAAILRDQFGVVMTSQFRKDA